MKPLLLILFMLAVTTNPAASSCPATPSLSAVAEDYVKLALEVGAYVPGYIDAYYGPKEWAVTIADSTSRRAFPAAGLKKKADSILKNLDKAGRGKLAALEELRVEFLRKQIFAVKAEIDALSGKKFTFDTESRAFYDAVAPVHGKEEFEKKVLYPLAGLDPLHAEKYVRVQKLLAGLSYAENEGARSYLDGKLSRQEAMRWMERYALESPERAAKSIDFWDTYRSYVINYNLGEEIVRTYIEKTAGKNASLERKWQIFYEILTTPRTPSTLAVGTLIRHLE